MSLLRPVRETVSASASLAASRVRRAPHHLVLAWILQAVIILVLGHVIPGVLVDDLLSALIAALVIALLNALVRPVLVLLTLPLSVATIGLLSLVINASIVVLAAPLVPGMEVNGFLPAFALAVALTVVTTLVNITLSVDEDEAFYAELARRVAAREAPAGDPTRPGLIVIQIDGLAAPILRNAIRVGLVPRMASWVRSGRYRLAEWDCPPPSQTSASQAGILHGNNDDIPAFRWFEKENGRLLVSNHPGDAVEIERRHSDGNGLLHAGGTSVGNLFSGDAPRSLFTMSRMTGPTGAADVDAFSLYFVDPAAFIRTIVLTISEVVKELIEARRQRRLDVQPRVHRGFTFAVLRAVSNVVLRDLNMTFLVESIARGVPIMYADFVDYDELAHHAGPERLETLRALAGVDRVLASLEQAMEDASRRYRIVVLSDHGQTQGATFLQRYGTSLEDLVRGLMGGDATMVAATGRAESFGPTNALLTELTQRPGVTGRIAGRAFRGRTRDGVVDLGPEEMTTTGGDEDRSLPELVVCASGNLANLYFNAREGRLSLEEIEVLYPGLVAALVAHPGIGLVMARTEEGGSVVLGAGGVHHLADGRVDGDDPLAPFGPRTAEHLRRLDDFPHVGDLLLNSSYYPDVDEVAAFEELVGSHGGMGGPQTRPFVMYPSELSDPAAEIVGAPALHRQLAAWTRELGVEPDAAAPVEHLERPNPRGVKVLATYQALFAVPILGLAGFVAIAGAGASDTIPGTAIPGSVSTLFIAGILAAIGLFALATAIGLWRRKRWAWMATLVLQAITVLQLLFALASDGFAGLASFGFMPAAIALLVFYYLSRPHVAAAFGRRPPSARPQGEDRA
jgi:uncharacterized membrane protein YvlD (DUF360 family)